MTVFALVDCNNFYASCERLFRPDLKHKPVLVLSNNDGCVVARSKEAKALGIKMGVPAFKIKDEIAKYGIQTFSSNYALYTDISSRVMRTLADLAPEVEIYSIDEAFLNLTGVEASISLSDFGKKVKETIDRWIGITVCVGIAPTKTLAKLANYAAKHYPATDGVVDLSDKGRQRRLMQITPVGEVWGVGRKISARLQQLGINTALELADAPSAYIREQFSVVLERTQRELHGESCLSLEQIPPTKKQIVCSRSFGSRITSQTAMKEAVSIYTARAAEKLRREQQKAKVLTVFILTNQFSESNKYSNAISGELINPSSDTRALNDLAMRLLKKIWKDGFKYAKAGVMLSDFSGSEVTQLDMFSEQSDEPNNQLMSVIDQINSSKHGTVFFARNGVTRSWSMKRGNLSPAYTTRWDDLPRVR